MDSGGECLLGRVGLLRSDPVEAAEDGAINTAGIPKADANDLSYQCGISGGEGWGVIHGDGLTLASAVDD
jgi:hypothetical protein